MGCTLWITLDLIGVTADLREAVAGRVHQTLGLAPAALLMNAEFAKPDGPAVWVAGYSNDYPGYVPSRRVLLEGGYETESGSWDPGLEERIIAAVHRLADRTRAPPGTRESP